MISDINDALIDFENKYSEKLMRHEIDGIHLFPCVRTWLFIEIEQRITSCLIPSEKTPLTVKANLLYRLLFNSFKLGKNPYISVPKADIAFLTHAINRVVKKDGKNFNRLYDYYVDDNPGHTLVLEQDYSGAHNPPEYTPSVKYLDATKILTYVNSCFPLADKNKNHVMEFVSLLLECLKSHFGAVLDFESMLFGFGKKIHRHLIISSEIIKIIERAKCKFVCIEDCCYGGSNAILTKLLRQRGITVVEFQHGVVARGHIAYNYGNVPESYLEYLPDYFLTYGQYWSDVSERLPVKKVVIGNPYLAEQVKIYKERIEEERQNEKNEKKVLIVSQTTSTDKFVALAKDLRKLLPDDYQITFRLHPGEVQFRQERCAEIENVPGIEINHTGGICDYISSHDFIVGDTSTSLFEAIPFEKTIFIWDKPLARNYIPQNIGIWFNCPEELAVMILRNQKIEELEPDYYWTLNWQKNFREFFG